MPAFMPVGTQGTVKGVSVEQIHDAGADMVLANAYHLALRPGELVVEQLGGLHQFMRWDGPILTDSGGFQLYSLAQLRRIDEDGVEFRSHIDGDLIRLTPERSVQIQEALGSDLAMVLDHVVALPNQDEIVQDACERTVRWASRCWEAAKSEKQSLMAIVQGGLSTELRVRCAQQLADWDFAGFAIGGLGVGEEPDEMYSIVQTVCDVLPTDKPRYLMGIGRPCDLLQAIRRGVDLFDCVLPTRNGRNSMAFTDCGTLRLKNLKYQCDSRPLQEGCPCPACRHSRGYIRHLFMAREMLGPILLSIHNLTYYQRLLVEAREAIGEDRFVAWHKETAQRWDMHQTETPEG